MPFELSKEQRDIQKAAREFAESFTAKYAEISEARPIYKELEGLFRFAGYAKRPPPRRLRWKSATSEPM